MVARVNAETKYGMELRSLVARSELTRVPSIEGVFPVAQLKV